MKRTTPGSPEACEARAGWLMLGAVLALAGGIACIVHGLNGGAGWSAIWLVVGLLSLGAAFDLIMRSTILIIAAEMKRFGL